MEVDDLLDELRRGSPSAGAFLVSLCAPQVLGYARAVASDLSDADREQVCERDATARVREQRRIDRRLRQRFRRRVGAARDIEVNELGRLQLLRQQDVVDDDFDWPRLEHVGGGFADHRDQCQRQRLPMEAHQVADERHARKLQERSGGAL